MTEKLPNRVLVYAHYNQFDRLAGYVVKQLELLRPYFSEIVFVSNSPISPADQQRLIGTVDNVISRPNIGFDFAAWRDGIACLRDAGQLAAASSVTIMNDTCFGPTSDLGRVFAEMETRGSDFWGLTNHRAHNGVEIGYKVVSVPEHLQSYFVTFNANVVNSQAFRDFWAAVPNSDDVHDVIRNLEIQLTQQLGKAGFTHDAYLDTRELDFKGATTPNFPHYLPEVLVAAGVPFIKIKSFLYSLHYAPHALDYLASSTFPVELAVNELSQITEPDYASFLGAKQRNYQHQPINRPGPIGNIGGNSVAIHLHVHYMELLPEFLDIFNTYQFPFTLFITTNQTNIQPVNDILAERQLKAEVIAADNLGRDIYPMLQIADQLQEFDIVGHFHTKKSAPERKFVGEEWRRELEDMLVKPADAIIKDFDNSPELGVVIADIPTMFRYHRYITPETEAQIAPLLNSLWQRLDLPRQINFADRTRYVMSYGTFFWARTDAIKQLLNLDISAEVPSEPLGANTILHAIERILVYVGWANGYDFRISEGRYLSGFVDVPAPPNAAAAPLQSTYWKLRGKASGALPPQMRLRLRQLRDRAKGK